MSARDPRAAPLVVMPFGKSGPMNPDTCEPSATTTPAPGKPKPMGMLDLARYPGGLTGIVRAMCAGLDRRFDTGMLDQVRAYEGKTLAECRALVHDTRQSILDVRQ